MNCSNDENAKATCAVSVANIPKITTGGGWDGWEGEKVEDGEKVVSGRERWRVGGREGGG